MFLCLVFSLPLQAQVPHAEQPAQVLVLGTYHFANPGLDVVKTEVADVLSDEKQAEIQAVVDVLARFRPTRIAVEQMPASATELDDQYQAYCKGEQELTRNEIQQLGFRLAANLKHPRLYPIDHGGEFPFDAVLAFAQKNDPEFVAFFTKEVARITDESNRLQREKTVGEILRWNNEAKTLARGHGAYMYFARVGAGDTNVGAELVAKWYERNIHIFANIQHLAEPGERILVIIGAGHAPILRELITSDPKMQLVETLEYLPPE
jgi:hypothetical protein